MRAECATKKGTNMNNQYSVMKNDNRNIEEVAATYIQQVEGNFYNNDAQQEKRFTVILIGHAIKIASSSNDNEPWNI